MADGGGLETGSHVEVVEVAPPTHPGLLLLFPTHKKSQISPVDVWPGWTGSRWTASQCDETTTKHSMWEI